jgi:hypothetical protein
MDKNLLIDFFSIPRKAKRVAMYQFEGRHPEAFERERGWWLFNTDDSSQTGLPTLRQAKMEARAMGAKVWTQIIKAS